MNRSWKCHSRRFYSTRILGNIMTTTSSPPQSSIYDPEVYFKSIEYGCLTSCTLLVKRIYDHKVNKNKIINPLSYCTSAPIKC